MRNLPQASHIQVGSSSALAGRMLEEQAGQTIDGPGIAGNHANGGISGFCGGT
jgi:hypothetical protein